jgi:hypothetical protein
MNCARWAEVPSQGRLRECRVKPSSVDTLALGGGISTKVERHKCDYKEEEETNRQKIGPAQVHGITLRTGDVVLGVMLDA